jgi:hypothetical protein
MKVAAKNRTEYFAAAGDRAADLKALDKLIRKSAPNLEPYFMATGTLTLLGYGKQHYRYASGREGDFCTVGLASQKAHLSLYVCVTKGGRYLAEIYGKRLGKASLGKSCIRFKRLEDLDQGVLAELLAEAGTLAQDVTAPAESGRRTARARGAARG